LCVIYVIFCCILIFGISKCKKSCFLPYIILDIIMMALAVLGALIGMATNNHHLFRVSFVFLIVKLYVEFCVISLYREYKLKKKIKNQHNGASSFDPSEGDQITAV
ncbi:CLUMA_CG015919, isoform A, partial [Clunio marinus]